MSSLMTAGLEMFLRKTRFTVEEHLQLIEYRRRIMTMLLLGKTTFPQLGSVKCLYSGNKLDLHELAEDKPQVLGNDSNYGLRLQGIFREALNANGANQKVLWALLRSGEWAFVHINFEMVTNWRGSARLTHSPRKETARSVLVTVCSLNEMLSTCQVMPDTVWATLGQEVEQISRLKYLAYKEVERIADAFRAESDALNLINDRLFSQI